MKLLTLLLAAAASALAAQHQGYDMECNGGTPGDGRCEANGLHTYCVSLPPKAGTTHVPLYGCLQGHN